ncbi:alpha/beta fold hydrolase [Streptomyces huiliensis]|uniref:alpha/beta fold hydrolase n=1 Tax=Streptomyces huiliensis TaxID=2876027 RepID=UPI001CBCCD5F|nr:alpha/beta fold hydrolase [Streptomyces huiliensis]MBZ4321112.1 alpha/beta fold hydrolase [Streptomyces huiliensis]
MKLRLPRHRRGRLTAALAALGVLAGAGTWTAAEATDGDPPVHREDRFLTMPESGSGAKGPTVRIDTSFFTTDGDARRPAVLLAHGFGGDKDDLRDRAEELARHGYAVLTWSARGFGDSTGRIGLNDPDREVADVSRLIDWLAKRPEVRLDRAGDPRVGIAGASYGGAAALLAAGHDKRVDAIAPQITYWDLNSALFPNDVFKKLWSGVFFTTGSTATGTDTKSSGGGCGRFDPELCAMYERVAVAGRPDDKARALLERRSPAAVARDIKVPTLLVQGQSDSLFPLTESDRAAEALARNGAPVAVDWIAGGHDTGGSDEDGRVARRTRAWFDRFLKEGESAENTDTGPAFRISRTGGLDTTDGTTRLRGASGDRYPGLRGDPRPVPLTGREQRFGNPAGGSPPAVSAVPGLGGLSRLSGLGVGVSLDFPGQYARFDSPKLTESVRATGTPTARVRVSSDSGEAVLFAKVYDVGPDGRQQLPGQLVTPLRVTDAKGGRTVDVRLPAVDHVFEAGHRMRLVLSATDLGYASPAAPAAYTVSLADRELSVPTAPGVRTGSAALPWWTWGLPAGGLAVAVALLVTGRRRGPVRAPDPALADVPLVISGLSKRYAKSADRYAVRDLSFRVERGQVLGLLGPNGAGKTTTLRMLMGLIRPDGGEVRVFGHAIRPGAPVLSRVGAFVEGAGFLPHLSGRANLDLYWRATGRPAEDAHVDEALEIAGLGSALDRAVRTYSQGMRQRLAIAQAMLGLPDLLILDEPTNGLDPPQIREMREVMIRYAAAGRTVIVSSHLLAEVEQSCTHLVVMDRGRLVTAGPVAEITGSGETLLVGVAGEVSDAVAEKVGALPGVASAVRAESGLLVRLDGGTTPELLVELVRLEIPVTGVGPHRRLEDAFLTLIGGQA